MNAWDVLRQKYGTLLAQSQTISWVWFAKQTYVSATTVLLTFFSVVPATLDLGNMVVAGALQGMQAFVTKAIRVYMNREAVLSTALPTAANDISRLINTGVLTLTIGQKNYGIWPLHALPGGGGVFASLAGAGAEAADEFVVNATNGIADPRSIYTLEHPLLIEPQISFSAQIQWPAAQTLTGNLDITVMLDGSLIRPVQ